MKLLNTILETAKKYWYIAIILVLTLAVVVVSFSDNAKLAGLAKTIKLVADNYRKQINTLDILSDAKTEKDKELSSVYEKNISEIEKAREVNLKKISVTKTKTVKKLKDKSADELAQTMKEEFKL